MIANLKTSPSHRLSPRRQTFPFLHNPSVIIPGVAPLIEIGLGHAVRRCLLMALVSIRSPNRMTALRTVADETARSGQTSVCARCGHFQILKYSHLRMFFEVDSSNSVPLVRSKNAFVMANIHYAIRFMNTQIPQTIAVGRSQASRIYPNIPQGQNLSSGS